MKRFNNQSNIIEIEIEKKILKWIIIAAVFGIMLLIFFKARFTEKYRIGMQNAFINMQNKTRPILTDKEDVQVERALAELRKMQPGEDLILTEKMLKKLSKRLLIPAYLPNGYKFERALYSKEDATQFSVRVFWTNGKRRIKYYLMHFDINDSMGNSIDARFANVKPFMVNGWQTKLTNKDEYYYVSCVNAQYTFTIRGRLGSKEEVIRIIKSVPKPY